jgi:SAM-dependent methyltransferase
VSPHTGVVEKGIQAVAHASACPACGGEASTSQLTVGEMMFGNNEEFHYARCGSCGTVWLLDVPADLAPYYPTDYYSVDLDPEQVLGRFGVRQFARTMSRSVLFGGRRLATAAGRVVRMRQFHSFLIAMDSLAFAGMPRGRRTRVLDVGCGAGVLVYSLGLAGVETAVGVDPFAPADRDFDSGASIKRADLAELTGTYDLVMFHHSLEHVPDPAESLRQARRLLAEGGRILVRMPTVSSEAFETYGAEWVQLDAPRHLTIFSRSGVESLAEQVGLKVEAVVDDSTAFQFWGSEQVRRGIPLMSPESMLVSPGDHAFTDSEVDGWTRRAAQLNASGRGDQAAWVLAEV